MVLSDDEDSENLSFTGNSMRFIGAGKGQHLVRILQKRELGRSRNDLQNIKAQIDFDTMRLTVPNKLQELKLDKSIFFGRFEGFMGITPDSHYLVAIRRSASRQTEIMFFTFTPQEAVLKRTIAARTPNGRLYHVKAIVPPNGGTYLGAYSHDEAEFKGLTAQENNLQAYLQLSPINFDFQINVESLIVVIPRFVTSPTPKRSLKHYVVAHKNGIILITGVAILNFMFSTDDQLKAEGNISRSMWRISRKKCYSWERSQHYSLSQLELGEGVGISGCSDFCRQNIPYEYSIHKNEDKISNDRETLPIFFFRDQFNIDSWLSRIVEKYIRKTAQFQGSAIRSLQDYEVDVSDLLDNRAYLHAFALFELEVFICATRTANEFHLFRLTFQWNLTKGTAYPINDPQHIGKVDNRFVFANRWWPLKTPGAVATMDFHRHVNNTHILQGTKSYNLVACDEKLHIPVV